MMTSNHVHLLVWAGPGGGDLAEAMRFLQGTAARDYNRRKKHSGAFWSDRYHPTLVQTGVHLSRCLFYVDMNMVRAAVVSHPAEWAASGYHELAGRRQRYRVLNLSRLLWCLGMPGRLTEFQAWYRETVDELVRSAYRLREPVWSETAAVGSRAWVEALASRVIVGRKAVVPLAMPSGLAVAEGESTYALQVSRRVFDPVRDGVT
jgi:putative transposase